MKAELQGSGGGRNLAESLSRGREVGFATAHSRN